MEMRTEKLTKEIEATRRQQVITELKSKENIRELNW